MPQFDAKEIIDSTVEMLTEQIKKSQDDWQNAQATEQKSRDEQRKEIADSVEEMRKQIEGLQTSLAKRPSLPGVEVAKAGEKNTAGRKFSMGRMAKLLTGRARADDKEYGYEVEVNKQAIEQGQGNASEDFIAMKTAINAGTDSAGGFFFIPHEVQDQIIPYLEEHEIAVQMGLTVITGVVGNVSWVVDQGVPIAYYVDTEAEEAITESVNRFSNIEIRPRVMGALVPLSFNMVNQPARAIDTWIQERIAKQFALKEDTVIFNGTGNKEPLGLLNDTGVQSYAWTGIQFGDATNVQTITTNLRKQMKKVDDENAFPDTGGKMGWAASREAFWALGETKDRDGRPMFSSEDQAMLSSVMQLPIMRTGQLNTGVSTAENLVFGDWTQGLLARYSGMAFAASTETSNNFATLRTSIRGVMAHDFVTLQPKAFCKATGLDISAVA